MTREEAIKVLNSSLEPSYFDITKEALTMAIEALEQPEQKKGEWILCENPIYSSFRISGADPYLCTVCYMKNDRQTKYCPNCGAKMEEEE